MNEKTIQILSLAFIAFSAVLITWIYAVAPVSVEDATVKARESINTIGNRTQRAAGIYEIDEEEFRVGLEAFMGERYPLARNTSNGPIRNLQIRGLNTILLTVSTGRDGGE